MNQQVES